MNEILLPRTATATAAIFTLNAAFTVGNAAWPVHKPIYSTIQSSSTFSFFDVSRAVEPRMSLHDFAQEIAEVFASLSEGQEPLGPEFETVWDENLDILYQS